MGNSNTINNYKVILSYDGSNFYGYAKQVNKRTIEEEIEKVLEIILSEKTRVFASGRTDKGVHANNQVINFLTIKSLDIDKFLISSNKLLPPDIHFKSVKKVSTNFNARFSAKEKEYYYQINLKEYNPLQRNNEVFIPKLNVTKMKEGATYFIGEKDFKNFTSKKEDEGNFIRTIYDIKFKENKDHLIIYFRGNGFMKYEIRKIVGLLIEVGKEKINVNEISTLFETTTREIIVYQAKPNGLYLNKVKY
ncbi:MAG TPA: tRNA pseudouridine(38-40) synthase TruA [Candidatus Onthovivens sp.]|nr:tRNA pseudouridine(38-40) synthase TruA [Candidatus Onthovivens sp.]